MVTLLYITLICLVILLITLVEAVILTWLKWAGFGQSLVAALAANFASMIALGALLLWTNHPNLYNLLGSWLVSILIETLILTFFRKMPVWRVLVKVSIANLASYLILILPAFYFGQQSLS